MNIWDKNALGPPLAKERDRNFPADIPLAPLAAPVDYWDDSLDNITPEPSNNWGRSAWDICVLNDLPLPGVCRVEPRARKRFDIKKNKGTQYATLTFTGEDPAEVLIIERIWTRGQLAQLQSQLIYLKSKQQGTTRDSLLAVQIAHPSCTLLQIHAVVIQGIDGLRPIEMW